MTPRLAAVVEADVLEADLAARRPRAACAPGVSATSCGLAIVSMPSCTVPMFSNRPATSHMIHCDIVAMRITSADGDGDRAERHRGPAATARSPVPPIAGEQERR